MTLRLFFISSNEYNVLLFFFRNINLFVKYCKSEVCVSFFSRIIAGQKIKIKKTQNRGNKCIAKDTYLYGDKNLYCVNECFPRRFAAGKIENVLLIIVKRFIMKDKFKKTLYLMLLLTVVIGWTQQPQLTTSETFNISSPGVSDFIKYGNIESSKYSGTLNLSIPLFSISDKDFPISASLNYNSSGFRPDKHESEVGLDWSLNIGGAITREVKGLADDLKTQPSFNGHPVNGYYVGLKNRGTPYPKDKIFDLSNDIGFINDNPIWAFGEKNDFNTHSETEPDIFHFNAMGLSGSFFIDHDKTVRVQTDLPVNIQVDLSGFTNQHINSRKCSPVASEIILRIDNGYTYVFGGDYQSLDYNLPIKIHELTGFDSLSHPLRTIYSWHLKQVIAPNGKRLLFDYDQVDLKDNFCRKTDSNDSGPAIPVLLNAYFNESRELFSTAFDNNEITLLVDGVAVEHNYTYQTSYNITKTSYLQSITYADRYKINLDYLVSNEKYQTKEVLEDSKFNIGKRKLNSIDIEGLGHNEDFTFNKQFTFGYTDKGRYDNGTFSANRMFLTSVQESGKEPYVLQYYKDEKLPTKHTKGTDYWGFWNGKDDNITTIPKTEQNRAGDFKYLSDEREPNPYLCDVALLKRLIYPTKGYSEFIYEPHQYAKRLERRSEKEFYTDIYSDMGVKYAGGARIKEIKDVSENGDSNKREFIYALDYITYENPNISSGIMQDWPRYIYIMWGNDGLISEQSSRIRNTTFNKHALDGSHIAYSEITELKSDGSMIEDTYLNYSNMPDGAISGIGTTDSKMVQTIGALRPFALHLNYVGIRRLDKSMYRGKISKQRLFTNEKKIVSQTEYTYNNLINDQYIIDIHASGFAIQSNKRFYSPVFLTQQKTTTFFDEGDVIDTKEFEYDYVYHKKTKEKMTNSLGQVTATEYTYPFDLNCSSGLYYHLVDNNLASNPVEIVTKVDNQVVSANVYEYFKPTENNLVLMRSNKILNSAAGISNYTPVSTGSKCALVSDSRMTQEYNYTKYNEREGNLLEFSFKQSKPTSLLWGYTNRHVIAKVEGVGYDKVDELASALGVADISDTEDTAAEERTLQQKLDELRQSLNQEPDAPFTTTYVYDPYVGVKGIGNPRGYWSSYQYDSNQRLINVWDQDDKLVESYEYHYKTNDIIPVVDTEDDYNAPSGFLHYYFSTGGDLLVKPVMQMGSGRYSYNFTTNQGNIGFITDGLYKISRVIVPCHGALPRLQIRCTATDNLTGKQVLLTKYVSKSCNPDDDEDPIDEDPID